MSGRIQEMGQSIREYRAERAERKRRYLKGCYEEIRAEFRGQLEFLAEEERRKTGKDSRGVIESVYLYRLMTSSCTESYESLLGMADASLYLDAEKTEIYWFPAMIYRNIEKDMEEVGAFLRKRFIRVEEYELLRLKRELLKDDWKLLQEMFPLLVEESADILSGSGLPLASSLQIISGDYMDKPEIKGKLMLEKEE